MATQNHLLRKYGITVDIYNKIYNKQEGKCAICNIHQSKLRRSLNVDHDHTTGLVRGLLCYSCNLQLGAYKDNISNIINDINNLRIKLNNAMSSIKYLEKEPYYLTNEEAKTIYNEKIGNRKTFKENNKITTNNSNIDDFLSSVE